MKKSVVLMIVLAMVLGLGYAQGQDKPIPGRDAHPSEKSHHPGDPRHNNPMMLKMKKDFIQENFVIEGSKKEAFWNAYNAYERSIIDAHKAQRDFRKDNNIPSRMNADSLTNLSDDIILKYYENNFQTKSLINKAEEKFFNDMKTILTPQQIAQYYILEKNFQTSAVKMNHPKPMNKEAKPMKMDAQTAPIDKSKAPR